MSAMAGSAADRQAGVIDFADVLRIDLFDHADHGARRGLLRLGIVGEVQRRASVRHLAGGIGGVACAALGAQFGLPLVHDLVHLFAGERFGQNLEIGRRRSRRMRMAAGRLLGVGCGEEQDAQGGSCGAQRGSDLQSGELLAD